MQRLGLSTDGKPHGGYYTQEQIKEIIAYAQQRYIMVVPEIDLPGHYRRVGFLS